MFVFLVILLFSALCFIIYTNSSTQIVHLKKQVMLLIEQNEKLEAKIKSYDEVYLKGERESKAEKNSIAADNEDNNIN